MFAIQMEFFFAGQQIVQVDSNLDHFMEFTIFHIKWSSLMQNITWFPDTGYNVLGNPMLRIQMVTVLFNSNQKSKNILKIEDRISGSVFCFTK